MCARLLKHTPEERQGRFYRASGRMFDRIIAAYGRTLRLGARTPDGDHDSWPSAPWSSPYSSIMIIPKGFFPVQDTGVILGISEAAQSISFPAMAERQQELASVILHDPAVESLSSFIGIDGTNATLNSGRILINLKPLEERKVSASEVIGRLQPELAKVDGDTPLPAARAGPDRRCPGEPHPVPVHHGGSRRE